MSLIFKNLTSPALAILTGSFESWSRDRIVNEHVRRAKSPSKMLGVTKAAKTF